MTVALLETRPSTSAKPLADTVALPGLRLIVLARIACEEGASRPELARELAAYVSGVAGRVAIDTELAQLVRAGYAIETRARFTASAAGLACLLGELSLKVLPKTWAELRDIRLVARALGMDGQGAARIKVLADADLLRVEILAQLHGLKLRGPVSAAKVRAGLALVALERAFGNKIKSELASSADFNAKTARVLAGQLLHKPRDAGTDKRLVALLAAEAVGSGKPDGDALRAALLRRLAGTPAEAPKPAARKVVAAEAAAAVQPVTSHEPVTPRPSAATRPDLAGFVKIVQTLAGQQSDGWPGNRKAMVSRVFTALASGYAGWGLTLVEFKAMLAECHRTGHLVLATADLKDKSQLDALRDSAISYKNTVWHLIRVED